MKRKKVDGKCIATFTEGWQERVTAAQYRLWRKVKEKEGAIPERSTY